MGKFTAIYVRNVSQEVKDGIDAIALAWGLSSQEVMRRAFLAFTLLNTNAVNKGQAIMAQQREAREE